MTCREAILEGVDALEGGDSESPYLDASLLMAEAVGLDTAQLLARYPDAVDEAAIKRYRSFLARRSSGEPIAYILGHKEFRGLDFLVDPRVLIPRPETEHLVEAALEAVRVLCDEGRLGGQSSGKPSLRFHDACTGSGCVGISLLKEIHQNHPLLSLDFSLSDISFSAIEIAAENGKRLLGTDLQKALSNLHPLHQNLKIMRSDFLDAVEGPFDIITANPPYLSDNEMAETRKRCEREPEIALSGGTDGLDPYRRLVPAAAGILEDGGFLIVEMGWKQASELKRIFQDAGFGGLFVQQDLAGRDRVIGGRMGWNLS